MTLRHASCESSESLKIGPIACIFHRFQAQNMAVLSSYKGISSQTELTNHIHAMLNLCRVQKIRQLTSCLMSIGSLSTIPTDGSTD